MSNLQEIIESEIRTLELNIKAFKPWMYEIFKL